MPKTKLRNLSFADRRKISKIRWALEQIDFGAAVYDLAVGTDEFTPRAERIIAHYGDVGLSMVVGNTTMALVKAGDTMFFNVGGTNVFGSDGVNTFLIIAGQTYVLGTTAGTTIGVD